MHDLLTIPYYTEYEPIEFKTDGAIADDLHVRGDHTIQQGETHVLKTGLYLGLEDGVYAEVTMRSSYAKKGLFIPNAPGLIDTDYRGEIMIIVANLKKTPVEIVDGHRIAQIKFKRGNPLKLVRLSNKAMMSETKRGSGGLGSTGR